MALIGPMTSCKVKKEMSASQKQSIAEQKTSSDSSKTTATSAVQKVDSSKTVTFNGTNTVITETEDTETDFNQPVPGTPLKTVVHKQKVTKTGSSAKSVIQNNISSTSRSNNTSQTGKKTNVKLKDTLSSNSSTKITTSYTGVILWLLLILGGIATLCYLAYRFSWIGRIRSFLASR